MPGRLLYLLGGNGAPNFGDELMAKAWLDDLSRAFPEHRIVLDCNSITTPRDYFEGRIPGLEVVSGFKIFAREVVQKRFRGAGKNPAIFLEALEYGLEFFEAGHAGQHPELLRPLEALAAADSLHIFGGGYINTGVWPHSGFLLGLAAAVASRFEIDVFATGVGITPLSLDGQDETGPLTRALAAFKLFECRDSYGFDKLFQITNGRAPVVNGVDDSFLLPPAPAPRPGGGRTLHLCLLRKALEGPQAALFDELPALAADFDRILYWDCVPRMLDRNIGRLRKLLPRMEVLDCHALVWDPLPVAPGDFMVTQRFHPHLVAARLGAAGVFLQEGVYYFDKQHSVLHLGSNFRKYVPGQLRATMAEAGAPAPILARDLEHMARKARVRDACYGVTDLARRQPGDRPALTPATA